MEFQLPTSTGAFTGFLHHQHCILMFVLNTYSPGSLPVRPLKIDGFPKTPQKKTYFPNLPPFFHGAQTRFFKTLGGKGIPDDFPKIVRLDYVHLFSSFFSSGYQVVHRDLKTENLLGRAVGSWICPVGNDGKKSEAFGSLVFRMVI